jgi:hypothetical protein
MGTVGQLLGSVVPSAQSLPFLLRIFFPVDQLARFTDRELVHS